MASKLLHLLHVVAILESCRGGGAGHGGQMVRTEEEETVVTLLRARGGSSDVPPPEVLSAGVSSDVPLPAPGPQGGPAGVSVSSSSSSPERRLLSARQSAHHHRDSMLSINMFKVYERYSKEPHISQKDGNTVRSFKAAPHGTSEGRERFRFNLSSIQESEHILSASFHFLYKRPRPHHQPHPPPRPWPCRRGAHSPPCGGEPPQLLLRGGGGGAPPSGAFAEPLGLNVTLAPPKRGAWQVIDVTALVRRARDAEEPLFAAEFDFGSLLARSQAQQKQQQQQVNKAHHGGHHHHHHHHHHHAERPSSSASLPYVLVYADDRAIDEPNSVAASLQRYGPFPPAAGNGEEERVQRLAADANAPAPAPASASASRARRDLLLLHPPPPPLSPPADQIQTNDLPEVHFSSLKNHELWQSTYFPPMKAKVKHHGRGGKAGQEGGGGGGLAAAKPPRVLSFDERTMKKARRRQWSEPRVCARRYLRVDFADIGWSEWVLAPKAFDAYYCAGTCGFPIPKVVRPSNHATIQSIVRAVGIVPGVPEPCCVPDKMSPLSVLFLDPERNMVLKVYPGMSVDTCACR